LILGSVPSAKSVEHGFYYMHPQNRFWKVIGALLGEELYHEDKKTKTETLLRHNIALYDAVYECDIMGSSDTKIFNPVAADIPAIIKGTEVQCIFCNGAASYNYLTAAHPHLKSISLQLPSTSPANASFTVEMLIREFSVILDYIK